MEWITTKQIQSSDGKTENIKCELWLNFEPTQWNKKTKSPVLEIHFYDRKVEGGWWIDNAKTKWYAHPPQKQCEIKFTSKRKLQKYCSQACARSHKTEETKEILRQKALENVKNGKHKGWKTRNIESYPEKFFKKVLIQNNIFFEFNKPIKKSIRMPVNLSVNTEENPITGSSISFPSL